MTGLCLLLFPYNAWAHTPCYHINITQSRSSMPLLSWTPKKKNNADTKNAYKNLYKPHKTQHIHEPIIFQFTRVLLMPLYQLCVADYMIYSSYPDVNWVLTLLHHIPLRCIEIKKKSLIKYVFILCFNDRKKSICIR